MKRFSIALSALFVICGTSFAASPEGRWRGNWTSQSTGHRGPLRAHIRPTVSGDYRAVFVGRFAGVVPFAYPATLERVPGSCDCYRSSQRLPLLGTYQMSANITATRFRATFRSRNDRGTLRMSRVGRRR